MAFEGLKSKLKTAGFIAGASLAGLIATPNDADAQVANLGITVRDSGNNIIASGNNLNKDENYFISVDITNISASTIDFDRITAKLQLEFGNGAIASNASFGYTPLPLPSGTPSTNDLFSGATMSANTFNSYIPLTSTQGTFSFYRDAISNQPSLSPSETRNIASFFFTPTTDAGSVNLSYVIATGDLNIVPADGIGSYSFSEADLNGVGHDLRFLDGAGSTTYNFTGAVPEPSTYAAIAGLGALGAAAYMRRRKRRNENIVDTEASTDESGRTTYTPKQD